MENKIEPNAILQLAELLRQAAESGHRANEAFRQMRRLHLGCIGQESWETSSQEQRTCATPCHEHDKRSE